MLPDLMMEVITAFAAGKVFERTKARELRPKTMADIDTKAVYAKWNSSKPSGAD